MQQTKCYFSFERKVFAEGTPVIRFFQCCWSQRCLKVIFWELALQDQRPLGEGLSKERKQGRVGELECGQDISTRQRALGGQCDVFYTY